MKNFDSVEGLVKELNKSTFGVCILAVTEFRMNKRNNPYLGRVRQAAYRTNVMLGANYQNVVNARLQRNGIDNVFVAQAPNGMHHVNEFILQSDKNPDKYYLRVTERSNEYHDYFLLLDGVEVTDENVINDIWSFTSKKPKETATQTEAGLAPEEQVKVCNFSVENIVALWQGDKGYYGEGADELIKRFEERRKDKKK
jgi:hypothetical protein